ADGGGVPSRPARRAPRRARAPGGDLGGLSRWAYRRRDRRRRRGDREDPTRRGARGSCPPGRRRGRCGARGRSRSERCLERCPRSRPGGAARRARHRLGGDALHALARWGAPSYDAVQLERLARRVVADSAGIPLLAVELLNAVALGLDLQEVPGVWPQPFRTLQQTFPGDLPDAITAAVRVNFHRLSNDAQGVLVAAAVLDGRVPAALLGRAAGVEGDALGAALDELEWQRWLAAEAR